MTVSVPVVAPAFAPDEEPEPSQQDAPARTRTGRHEPIRSSMPRMVGRGAALGLTVAAGVAGGHMLRNDLNAGLVAGAQLGSVAAGMAFVGAWAERRRMTRVAATLSDLAVELATAGVPDLQAAPRLLEVPGADRVALEAATRRAVDQLTGLAHYQDHGIPEGDQGGRRGNAQAPLGDDRRAVRLLSRVALLRPLP